MMRQLNYLWRLMATGFCFLTFSVGGLILAWLVIPIAALFCKTRQQKQRKVREIIYRSFRFFVWIMSSLGIIEFKTEHAKAYLQAQRGKVVIANHPSLIDVVVMISLMPHATCVVKESLWKNPFFGRVIDIAGYIKNSGDVNELIQQCRASLEAGYALVVFPEGTRTNSDGELNLQRGASNIALRCNAEFAAVLIHCSPTTLTKQDRWYTIPPRKIIFTVIPGEPLDISQFRQRDVSLSLQARQLTRYIKDYFVEGLKSYE